MLPFPTPQPSVAGPLPKTQYFWEQTKLTWEQTQLAWITNYNDGLFWVLLHTPILQDFGFMNNNKPIGEVKWALQECRGSKVVLLDNIHCRVLAQMQLSFLLSKVPISHSLLIQRVVP